jgi:hypothetical protein
MAHLLSLLPYKDLTPEHEELGPRPDLEEGYVRPPLSEQRMVPSVYGDDNTQEAGPPIGE